MYCTKCGKQIPDDSKFCTSCGTPVDPPPEKRPEPPDTPSEPVTPKHSVNLEKTVDSKEQAHESTPSQSTPADDSPAPAPSAERKRKPWVLVGAVAAAAAVVAVVAVAAAGRSPVPVAGSETLAETSSGVAEVQTSRQVSAAPMPSLETVEAVPSAQIILAAPTVGTQGETFSLTLEQSRALIEQVVEPLLVTEWDWVIDYEQDDGYYNPASWKNQQRVQIRDLISREREVWGPDEAYKTAFWNDFGYALSNADMLPYDNGPRNGKIFGDESRAIEGRSIISKTALQKYFDDAFGNADLVDTITGQYGPTSAFARTSSSNMESAQNQYGLADDWRFYIGDPGSFATIDSPTAPLQVVDGKLTLRGTMSGAWGDWSGYTDVYWDITLDVLRDAGSPYGCIVTGYQVTAEDQTIPIPTAAAPTVRTNTPPPAQPAPGFDSNGLVFADSSTRYLTDADLQGLSKEMLGFARNEIFARNGNIFRKDKYINHYTQYDWYNSIPNKRHDIYEWELNPIEQANIALILEYENS